MKVTEGKERVNTKYVEQCDTGKKSGVTNSVKIWINETEEEQIRRGNGLPVLWLVKSEFMLPSRCRHDIL